MKILFITLDDVSQHKGSSTHIREKVTALRRRGHAVTLMGCAPNGFDFPDFINIGTYRDQNGRVGRRALTTVVFRLFLRILGNAKHVDIIHVREPLAAFVTVITKPLHHRNIVYEVNSLDSEEIRMKGNSLAIGIAAGLMSFLQRIDARYADKIIVITDRVKRFYMDRYHVPEPRITVLGVTADTDKFRPIDDPALLQQYRNHLHVPDEACLALFVGNMAHWQDFELLVRSAKILKDQKPPVLFVIAGQGSRKEWLEKTVWEEGLGERVLVLGAVPHAEVNHYINAADVCISLCKELTSGYSPMKLYEYLACGKPVVATRVSGYELVEQIQAGKLIDADDAEGFASALFSYAKDPALRAEHGANALRFARERLGWNRVIAELESVMKEFAPAPAADTSPKK